MKISGSDIHLLKIFDSVVRNNGFSAAQIELGLSQPTISNHITALEERLGVKLCQRGRRGFMLTEKGQIVHEITESLIDSIDDHSNKLSELKGKLVGQLKIAAVDCIGTDAKSPLPFAIAELNETAPSVNITLEKETPQNVLTKTHNGQVHVGIGSFDNHIQGLDYEDLYEETHSLYCGKAHPLYGKSGDDLTKEMIDQSAWIHRGYWNVQRQRALQLSDQDKLAQDIESQTILILSGKYIGLLPDHHAKAYMDDGRLFLLNNADYQYSCMMQMITLAGRKPLIIENFCEIIRQSNLTQK